MSVQHQALLLVLLAALVDVAVTQNTTGDSNQTGVRGRTYSGIVFALSATGVVTVLMVIVALAGGLIVAKMARKKEKQMANGI